MGDENAKHLPLRDRKLLEHALVMIVYRRRGRKECPRKVLA